MSKDAKSRSFPSSVSLFRRAAFFECLHKTPKVLLHQNAAVNSKFIRFWSSENYFDFVLSALDRRLIEKLFISIVLSDESWSIYWKFLFMTENKNIEAA
jgi:hypothetical protein